MGSFYDNQPSKELQTMKEELLPLRNPNAKNLIIVVLLFLLTISVGGNFVQSRLKKEAEIKSDLDRANSNTLIAQKTARVAMLDSLGKAKERSAKQRATKDSVAIQGFKTAISKTALNLAIRRVPVQPLIDSVQELGLFVETYDSLSAEKDSLIVEMGLRHSAQILDLQEVNRLNRGQIEEQVGISNLLQDQVVQEQAESRKWKKKADKKFSVGPTAGYGVSKEGLSPQIGISVQWRLIRF